ncbi:transposase [Nonomuraea sp. NPDC049750]|uniref:transposase n=1 Tax=Nonomuraea sp. NPDC049750 TaxID=3154738 RepID=UPI003400FAED
MRHWRGPRGIRIEAIILDRRPTLRITQTIGRRQYLIAYCRTVREVGEYVQLHELVEVIPLPQRATMGK